MREAEICRGDIVFCDASVLFQAQVRHLLLWIAVHKGCFRPKWSRRVQNEWINGLLKKRPELRGRLEDTRYLMEKHLPEALVENYSHLEASIELPDSNDVHVFAASIECNAKFLLTENLKDFPPKNLAVHGIQPISFDTFLSSLAKAFPYEVWGAIEEVVARLKRPRMSVEEYCENLSRKGFLEAAGAIRALRF